MQKAERSTAESRVETTPKSTPGVRPRRSSPLQDCKHKALDNNDTMTAAVRQKWTFWAALFWSWSWRILRFASGFGRLMSM